MVLLFLARHSDRLLGSEAAALPIGQEARVLTAERSAALQDPFLGAALECREAAALRRRAPLTELKAPRPVVGFSGCRERGRDCETAEQCHFHRDLLPALPALGNKPGIRALLQQPTRICAASVVRSCFVL